MSRGGSERDIVATVGKRPMPKFDEGSFSMTVPRMPFPPGADFPPNPRMERLPRVEGMLPPGTLGEPLLYQMGSGRRIGIGGSTLTR